jgi:uncharacterized protein (DUF2237 family)
MSDLNVLGTALVPCSYDPLTGYFRDGCCKTDETDRGSHLICARVTAEFLAFSTARGNDLVTPLRRPQSGRPLVPVRQPVGRSAGRRRRPTRCPRIDPRQGA